MHLPSTLALLTLLLSVTPFAAASAQNDDAVVFVTMTTDVEVTSTVYIDTVTMTGQPPAITEEPTYIPLTTILSNGTYVPPSATVPVSSSSNSTIPTNTGVPTKDKDSAAVVAYGGSAGIAMAVTAGAIAAVANYLL